MSNVPATVASELLRRRADGVGFDDAWSSAVAVALVLDCEGSWGDALHATQAGWRRAYTQLPATPAETACATLNKRTPGLALPSGRLCIECEGSLGPKPHANLKTCHQCIRKRRQRQTAESDERRATSTVNSNNRQTREMAK